MNLLCNVLTFKLITGFVKTQADYPLYIINISLSCISKIPGLKNVDKPNIKDEI